MKRSPPMTTHIAPLGGLFASPQRHNDNSGSSDHGSQTATGNDSQTGKHTNQCHTPHGYGYPLSPQPFPGALQFYRHSPFNMTQNSSQATTKVSQHFPSYGPQWQGYDLHQGGFGESQMFPSGKSQDNGRHLQVHRECLQDCWDIFQSIGQYLPALLLRQDLLLAPLGDIPIASQNQDYCRQRNHRKQMSQRLRSSPQWQRYYMTIVMQMMRATIRQTWAVQWVTAQLAQSKSNSPWSNWPQDWAG